MRSTKVRMAASTVGATAARPIVAGVTLLKDVQQVLITCKAYRRAKTQCEIRSEIHHNKRNTYTLENSAQ